MPESAEVERGHERDDLDGEERARLHEALRAAWAEASTAETISAEELIEELDAAE